LNIGLQFISSPAQPFVSMKPSLTCLKNHFVCFGAALFLLASVNAAKAQVLLTVDISNPKAVVITAVSTGTYNGTFGNPVTTNFNSGIDLLGLFTADAGTSPIGIDSPTPTLTTGNGSAGGEAYSIIYPDNFTTDLGIGYHDLSLYGNNTTAGSETFDTSDAAFAGSITLNLSGYSLQDANYQGTIITGANGSTPNTVIGSYQVISDTVSTPEPSTWALLLGSLAGLVIWRAWSVRRRPALAA